MISEKNNCTGKKGLWVKPMVNLGQYRYLQQIAFQGRFTLIHNNLNCRDFLCFANICCMLTNITMDTYSYKFHSQSESCSQSQYYLMALSVEV